MTDFQSLLHIMSKQLLSLTGLHVFFLCLSNVLVQHPIIVLGFHTTWGAFSYPVIFILTDLTTRLTGAATSRRIIFLAMLPGLCSSYLISNWFSFGSFWVNNPFALRIALASFSAYVLGQLADISFFQRLRQRPFWWVAPTVAGIFGNILDTYSFFFIAFYQSSNLFLRAHWLEIASVDLVFKLVISIGSFVPLYGLLLSLILSSKQERLMKHGSQSDTTLPGM
ncbi:7-cyano-7-deazaguanine/7-aminomethyl-7-deazaguanine transporter [Legionella sp. 16cNR16C]|uniref:7-cyano-7-deazaguanine/7-aminomethyl-7- deazaguanine transporter n=1 Tax=Legionella sp. 16cNR16C TaxID=2905656 RepID=UPI001E6299A3|nr:7-cyano-7-deazaguanine/7-aminomethyl-7-deazaguanine transporter [Legionella sp. 16cNR16C]MCE3046210.1 7-cyano-7-deazaguanine/7-aminomethyl-7-deazaguanine transporter [Legionella sp. 16cNR16C]